MCGIAGIISKNKLINNHQLFSMKSSLKHRGPDDNGIILLDSDNHQLIDLHESIDELPSKYTTAFVHTRLSILDLSKAGQQPMPNIRKTLWITYNGEIYNYLSIRAQLIDIGYQFNTETDTEVVLNAYDEWGENCVHYFNGMFAFAIYDCRNTQKPVVFFARDRVGKKPFFYYHFNDQLYFSSEVKAIFAGTNKSFLIDEHALNYYLAFGYSSENRSIYKNIHKLPPGSSALYNISTNALHISKYWHPPIPEKDNEKYSENELLEELEVLLEDAVKLRMISDVPIGIFLSGGIDSSLVAVMAAKCSPEPIKTFTISFPGSNKDESSFARIVANHVGSRHTVLSGIDNVFEIIDEFKDKIDEPIADSSILPTYLVSKLTREYVTVALGGDGGDELFGGYSHYLYSKYNYCLPQHLLTIVNQIVGKFPAGLKGRNKICALTTPSLEQNIWSTPYFDIHLRKKLLHNKILELLGDKINSPEVSKINILNKGINPIDKLTRLDLLSYLPEDILTKVDRASMACSLEVRAPWLDYRIIEFAFKKVHYKYKVFNNQTRILQKKLAKRLLPKKLNIHRKQGFSLPIDSWLRTYEGKSWCLNILNDSNPDLFKINYIHKLIQGENKGRANGSRIWALAMLQYALNNQKGILRASL